MATKIFFPTLSLLGLSLRRSLDIIKSARFDGAEVLASPANRRRSQEIRTLVRKYGLELHWHQQWSYAENTNWYNMIATLFGLLEPNGYSLKSALPTHSTDEPFVAYADRWQEAGVLSDYCIWLQTCTVMNNKNKHSMTFDRFREIVRTHKPRLVFDTQHYLEWRFGTYGVSGIPVDGHLIKEVLEEGWREVGAYVEEIHLNDFDPRRGDSRGRNLLLGDGVLPLESFAATVRRSDWHGTVVPEIAPWYLLRSRVKKPEDIREQIFTLFCS